MLVMIVVLRLILFRVIFVVMLVFMNEQFNRVPWLNDPISPTIADVERCFQFSKWVDVSVTSVSDIIGSSYLVMKLSVGTYLVSIIIRI